MLLTAVGAQKRIMLGHHERPLALASQWGAISVDTTDTNATEAVADMTEGQGADVVYEIVGGTSSSLDEAAQIVRPGGAIVVLGCFSGSPAIPMPSLLRNEIDLIPSWSYACFRGIPEFQIALDMVSDGCVDLAPIITHHYPLADLAGAFGAALDKGRSGAVKVMVHPAGH